MFYIWEQNNSGGSFNFDDKLTHRVVIEANSYEEAERKALDIGVYYNGVDRGLDCGCCGDRWYTGEEFTIPEKYNSLDFGYGYHPEWDNYEQTGEKERKLIFKDLEDYLKFLVMNYGWESPDARIFYLNGKVKSFFQDGTTKEE